MQVETTPLAGVLVFVPTPFRDGRGFFTRTFDADVAARHGVDQAAFVQESQSRSHRHVVRGLHGRSGRGEGKLVRCARGRVHFVVVDARPESATFGHHTSMTLDDDGHRSVFVPARMLVGFQVLSEFADVCYKIDRPHAQDETIAVRFDDPDLAVPWPGRSPDLSDRDRTAGSWATLRASLDPTPVGQ